MNWIKKLAFTNFMVLTLVVFTSRRTGLWFHDMALSIWSAIPRPLAAPLRWFVDPVGTFIWRCFWKSVSWSSGALAFLLAVCLVVSLARTSWVAGDTARRCFEQLGRTKCEQQGPCEQVQGTSINRRERPECKADGARSAQQVNRGALQSNLTPAPSLLSEKPIGTREPNKSDPPAQTRSIEALVVWLFYKANGLWPTQIESMGEWRKPFSAALGITFAMALWSAYLKTSMAMWGFMMAIIRRLHLSALRAFTGWAGRWIRRRLRKSFYIAGLADTYTGTAYGAVKWRAVGATIASMCGAAFSLAVSPVGAALSGPEITPPVTPPSNIYLIVRQLPSGRTGHSNTADGCSSKAHTWLLADFGHATATWPGVDEDTVGPGQFDPNSIHRVMETAQRCANEGEHVTFQVFGYADDKPMSADREASGQLNTTAANNRGKIADCKARLYKGDNVTLLPPKHWRTQGEMFEDFRETISAGKVLIFDPSPSLTPMRVALLKRVKDSNHHHGSDDFKYCNEYLSRTNEPAK